MPACKRSNARSLNPASRDRLRASVSDVRPRTPCCSKYALVSHSKNAEKIGPEIALLDSMVAFSALMGGLALSNIGDARDSLESAGAVGASVPCNQSNGHLGSNLPHCSLPHL